MKQNKQNKSEEESDYYIPKKVSNFLNNNYIKYESNDDGNKNLSLEEYFNKIRPYLRDIKIDLQETDTRKIQLTMAINFISSNDADEERVMYTKSSNKEFMTYDNANDTVDELFERMIMQMILLINFSRHFFQDIKTV